MTDKGDKVDTVTLNGITYNQVAADGKIILEPVAPVAEKTYSVDLTFRQLLMIHDLLMAVTDEKNSPVMWGDWVHGEFMTVSPRVVDEMRDLYHALDVDAIVDDVDTLPAGYNFSVRVVAVDDTTRA